MRRTLRRSWCCLCQVQAQVADLRYTPVALAAPSGECTCLDEELLAQKGFHNSEILMADSVALLRRKVENESLAVQDGTMNSVITLATIEVRCQCSSWAIPSSTHKMIWALDTASPPTPEWQLSLNATHEAPPELTLLEIDEDVKEVFIRLRSVFQRAQQTPFTSTRLHDLAGFVIHRLLPSAQDMANETEPLTECARYAIILYMFIMQGPTYFTHVVIFNQILGRFAGHLQRRGHDAQDTQDPINVWFLAVGMVASTGTPHYAWFRDTARAIAVPLQLRTWDDASNHIKNMLWLETRQGEGIFRPHWDAIFDGTDSPQPSCLTVHRSPNIPNAAFI
ncbi:hypothetical protein CHGG_07392 [Chaetomium globosum CBS 148.51]|uniref:Transcription factor domain-containing protein n=1 Tax=Chaetomium globosum (strain ATCC 6205 / CBS 148.51 / DSM 1962 / NBRC 6347 / NRRL 1970) TaxID=306901 RepID=Q2GXB2_CHAGB|nr:uncharacterized protein CHGG_07392 [Chaetomium globosum CBS 148.51]EAQ86139.1 hypothetical protein CHGG_07392 [Chaetomium globosum CBS 148.51]